jgi:hypothetical protein
MKVLDRIKAIAINNNIILVSIIGLSGTGKTNFALWLSEKLINDDLYDDVKIVNLEENLDEKSIFDSKNTIYIFDDVTYLLSRHSKDIDKFLRALMLARHTIERAMFIFISHYSTSTLPVLRSAHVRVVSSITSIYELKQYSKLFNADALWDFYQRFIRLERFIFLVNALGFHAIIRIPLSNLYKMRFERQHLSDTLKLSVDLS